MNLIVILLVMYRVKGIIERAIINKHIKMSNINIKSIQRIEVEWTN